MIEWETTGGGLRITDSDGAVVSIRGEGLSPTTVSDDSIPRPVDATLQVTAERITLPSGIVRLERSNGVMHELSEGDGHVDLPDGQYLADISAEIKTYVRFDNQAEVARDEDCTETVIQWPDATTVVLGFRSRHSRPAGTIRIPKSVEGLATALSHLHSADKTASPDKSYPTLRGHPPLIEITEGSSVSIPDHIANATSPQGFRVISPPDVGSLYCLAPLIHYLQADVSVESVKAPSVTEIGGDFTYSFDSSAPHREIAQTLKHVFFLDCLVRNGGPHGTDLFEADLLDFLGIDPSEMYDTALVERVKEYLSIPFSALSNRLPDWHLAVYMKPEMSHAPLLPFVLDRLAVIHPPETTELTGEELKNRSLDDFYRGERVGPGQVASVDILDARLEQARIHGWIADGTPIDVYKALPAAYLNQLQRYSEDDEDGIAVSVVLNDSGMVEEQKLVQDIYTGRSDGELAVDVDVYSKLDPEELADIVEADYDLFHYIGHCEQDGLRCRRNQYLSIESVSQCGADAFFLNACGSYYEGLELIEKGAIAGAITFADVMNNHAQTVGQMFSRLLIHGFSVERALQLSRDRIMMGKDYATVGDGTYCLTQNENRIPITGRVEQLDDDEYILTYDQYSTSDIGGYYRPFVSGDHRPRLCGNPTEISMSGDELNEYLARADIPVIYDGDIHWSSSLTDF